MRFATPPASWSVPARWDTSHKMMIDDSGDGDVVSQQQYYHRKRKIEEG